MNGCEKNCSWFNRSEGSRFNKPCIKAAHGSLISFVEGNYKHTKKIGELTVVKHWMLKNPLRRIVIYCCTTNESLYT